MVNLNESDIEKLFGAITNLLLSQTIITKEMAKSNQVVDIDLIIQYMEKYNAGVDMVSEILKVDADPRLIKF